MDKGKIIDPQPSSSKHLFLEKKQILRISCYKVTKFAAPRTASLLEKISARKLQECPHGFTEMKPVCQHCIWFKKDEVFADERPIQTDRIIDEKEIAGLAVAYFTQEQEQLKKLE